MLPVPVDPRAALDSANESDRVQRKLSIDAMKKRVSGGPSEEKKLREACEGFESIFLQKMWEQMRKNVKKEGYLHSKDEEAYQSMFDVELAKKMASAGGIGLADMLYEQLGQKLHNASKTTGSGLMREPLPIEPARPPKPEVAEAPAPAAEPADLYTAVEELPEQPTANPLAVALEELAASRDPALDPATAPSPMFDLQTGVPMHPGADKMKEDS
ncbi:MAG: rod-binding protein, partial [Deltaproteobacteria bacterium]|nr:rod-binding protein [Deltaproteobacteria bacterium]